LQLAKRLPSGGCTSTHGPLTGTSPARVYRPTVRPGPGGAQW